MNSVFIRYSKLFQEYNISLKLCGNYIKLSFLIIH